MKFAVNIIYFLIWVAVTTGIFYLLIALDWSRFFVLVPALGGLALWFYMGYKAEQKPPKGPAILLLFALGTASACSQLPQSSSENWSEARTAAASDSLIVYRNAEGFDCTVAVR